MFVLIVSVRLQSLLKWELMKEEVLHYLGKFVFLINSKAYSIFGICVFRKINYFDAFYNVQSYKSALLKPNTSICKFISTHILPFGVSSHSAFRFHPFTGHEGP